jgi:hypothetical protein
VRRIWFLTCRSLNETGNGTVISLNKPLSTEHEEGLDLRVVVTTFLLVIPRVGGYASGWISSWVRKGFVWSNLPEADFTTAYGKASPGLSQTVGCGWQHSRTEAFDNGLSEIPREGVQAGRAAEETPLSGWEPACFLGG